MNPYTPAGAMLRVLPDALRAFERFSAVMVATAAKSARRPMRLLFMAAPPAENLIPAVTAGLLVPDLAYRYLTGRPLLNGDILVLTHAPRRSMELLQNLSLDGIMISQIWEVESFTRYTSEGARDKPRVYFANPGSIQGNNFGSLSAVIIESVLPFMLRQLPALLSTFRGVPVGIAITPPLLEDKLCAVNENEELAVWLWDPTAKREPFRAARRVWICKAEEIEDVLNEAETGLWKCLATAQGSFPPLGEAWRLYHQLRQMVVPLADLEDAARPSLRDRLNGLRAQEPPQPAMEVHWHTLLSALDRAYNHLIALQEPPKFWALASRLDELLCSPEADSLRVVVSTWVEQRILVLLLISLFEQRVLEKIEVLTPTQEVRRIAAGDIRRTLLAGYRPASYRFLDLYFPKDVEVIAYPYEAALEEEFWSRAYTDLERWQRKPTRHATLARLGFERVPDLPPPTPRPALVMSESEIPRLRRARIVYPEFDIDRLVGAWAQELDTGDEGADETSEQSADASRAHDIVQVVLEDGRCLTYFTGQFAYVFYEAQDQVRRMRAAELRPGMRLVLLVDTAYEGLYERLLDAVRVRTGRLDRLYLDLWQAAKDKLRKEYSSLKELHDRLIKEGLSVQYQAFTAYFRGPDLDVAALAPLREEDMAVMARHSRLFPDEQMIRETFRRIQKERDLRRRVGRALHRVLRSIVSGMGYSEALRVAREIGHEVYDILAAVEVVTIREVNSNPG